MRGFVYCDLYYTQPKVVVVTQLMKKMHSENNNVYLLGLQN